MSSEPTGPLVGDRVPFLAGMRLDESFYSLDEQAGRPVALLVLGDARPEQALPLLQAFHAQHALFDALNSDSVALLSPLPELAEAYGRHAESLPTIVFLGTSDFFNLCDVARRGPQIIVLDRGGRIIARFPVADAAGSVARSLERLSALAVEMSRRNATSAPVLIIPNVIECSLCRELIVHFEGGDHREGVMASATADGGGYSKFDQAKKRRRDLVLAAGIPLHGHMMDVLSRRIVPEIKSAYQVDVAHVDRLLVVRYDGTGGYFRRHRDDRAPQVAFRQFALSLNLNTGDYAGGHLTFPEFNDDCLDPPAGAAVVFSASLLHEATSVTCGSRYVLTTFLHSAEAEARRLAQIRFAA